jgi:hypothetical protein
MRSKNHLELIPIDTIRFFMGFYVCIPPIGCKTFEPLCGQQDLLLVVALHMLKFLLHYLEPLIDVHWLYRM